MITSASCETPHPFKQQFTFGLTFIKSDVYVFDCTLCAVFTVGLNQWDSEVYLLFQ